WEAQEFAIHDAWNNMKLIDRSSSHRLVAALHYFYVACRLLRMANTPGEFMAEVLLNLSKTLEVLFPSHDGATRQAARAGLRALGYEDDSIEKNYIPAMLLRNELGVGHVHLGDLSQEQLIVLQGYTEHAENAFRQLMTRILEASAQGTFEVERYI